MIRILLFTIFCLLSLTGHTATPPPAADVFKFSANSLDPNTLALTWDIKPGFFLYKDRFRMLEASDHAFQLGEIHYPKATQKIDHQGKRIPIYRHQVILPLPVLGNQAGEALFSIAYQGCADDGFCYPPETKTLKLGFNDKRELMDVSVESESTSVLNHDRVSEEPDQLKQLFYTHNWAIIFLSFFGFGLLLSFTPCVLPMIPVLSGIILGQGKKISTHKSFLLSLSYILSMATTYAIVGAVVALMGSNLQMVMQNPWAIASFSVIFLLLALSMFEFYDLRLPSSWQAKLTQLSHSKAGGYYLGAAIMGCLSTLILSPCVTAPLIGALGYIANTGDVARGSLTLFFMGLGMGTPLLLIGTSAGKWVPKTGEWMHTIKAFFGLLLLAVAIELLSRILPSVLTMVLWASLLIFTGIYSGALEHARTHQDKFRQGVGIVTLLYGILILIGASQGSHNPLQPLAQLTPLTAESPSVTTVSALKQALLQAKGRPVLVDFYADWCESCKQIEATTLNDPNIVQALKSIVMIKVDVTQNNGETHALLKDFDVVAPPTFIFYNKNGQELKQLRLAGEVSAKTLMSTLQRMIPALN
jgi:thiol:disulfide interchange protein DsbD